MREKLVTNMKRNRLQGDQASFEPSNRSVRMARDFVCSNLQHAGAAKEVIRDFQLVVSELATNAIDYGDENMPFIVRIDTANPEWWTIEVLGGQSAKSDQIKSPADWKVATSDKFSGRGLGIVRALMDEIDAKDVDGVVQVTCRLRRRIAIQHG